MNLPDKSVRDLKEILSVKKLRTKSVKAALVDSTNAMGGLDLQEFNSMIFDRAQHEVHRLMENDSFARFCQSESYKQYLQRKSTLRLKMVLSGPTH